MLLQNLLERADPLYTQMTKSISFGVIFDKGLIVLFAWHLSCMCMSLLHRNMEKLIR